MKEKIKKTNKTIIKPFLKCMLLFVLIELAFLFVHDAGHIIACILLNVKIESITVRYTEFGPTISIKAWIQNQTQEIIIAIAGSLCSCTGAILLNYYAKKKQYWMLCLSTFGVILIEGIYWIFSCIFSIGDAYVVIKHSYYLLVIVIIIGISTLLSFSIKNIIDLEKELEKKENSNNYLG